MQKLLSLKHVSQIPRNLSNATYSHHYRTFISLSKTNPTHFFYRFTSPHSWRSQNSVVSEKVYGLLSNPTLVKQLVPNTLLKYSSRSFMDCRVRFLRSQFFRRSFEFNPTYGSFRRGWRSWFPRPTANDMVLGLIVANVAVFMLWRIADRNFMMKNFTISLDNFTSGRVHTLITSAFSHIEMEHLISNMIGLYFFGMSIGSVFGPEFLLKLYLAGAVGGSVFYLVHHAYLASSSKGKRVWNLNPSRTPGLGASGAVNAIMLLNIFLFPKSTLYFNFFIPVPAILLGIFLIGKDMLRIIEGDSQISGSAHLGGAAVAAIAWARIRKGRF